MSSIRRAIEGKKIQINISVKLLKFAASIPEKEGVSEVESGASLHYYCALAIPNHNRPGDQSQVLGTLKS